MDIFISSLEILYKHIIPYLIKSLGILGPLVLGWFARDLYDAQKGRRANKRKQRKDREERNKIVVIARAEYRRLLKYEDSKTMENKVLERLLYYKNNPQAESKIRNNKAEVTMGRIMDYERDTGKRLRFNDDWLAC